MNYPTILFDFDDTLFNTAKLKKQLISVMNDYGISEELYNKTYTQVREFYDFDKHVEVLQTHCTSKPECKDVNFTRLLESLEMIFSIQNMHSLLYPQASNMLLAAQKHTKQLVLFTKGSVHFQSRKVEASGLAYFFGKNILYTPISKVEFLKNYPQYQQGLFVNDKASENEEVIKAYPQLETVLVNSNQENHLQNIINSYFSD